VARWKISFNTMDVAATPKHDCGVWHLYTDDENVKGRTEDLIRLGFAPEVSQVTAE